MKYKYITSIITISIVLFLSAMSIITPDKKISELEGKRLQLLPIPGNIINEEFNRNAYLYELLSGDIFKKWDSYFSDHIYNRDTIVSAYTNIQGGMDKKYINGAFLGEDNYIFSLTNLIGMGDSSFIQSANYFNEFANRFKDSKTYIVNLPQKEMVYEKYVPIDNYKSNINVAIDEVIDNIDKNNIGVLDFRKVINKYENLFYKTDHHWNMNGTYKGYEYIINSLNNEFIEIGSSKSKNEFEVKKYKNYFIGTDGRKVGQLVKEAEDIEVYYSDDYKNYKVYNQEGEVELLQDEFLNKEKFNNDYLVYLGGDNSKLLIENTKADNDLKIVMIGDSMDNALIPLMSMHFNKLYSYDLRHYKDDIIKEIDNIKPDIIMLIGLSHNFVNGSESEIFKWDIR